MKSTWESQEAEQGRRGGTAVKVHLKHSKSLGERKMR